MLQASGRGAQAGTALVVCLALCALQLAATPAQKSALANSVYSIALRNGGAAEIRAGRHSAVFEPRFTILHRTDDPQLNSKVKATEANFGVPAWKSAGDGSPTPDLFQAGAAEEVAGTGAYLSGEKIAWTFQETHDASLRAELTLPGPLADPLLTFRFTPRNAGWYSVGYTGAPRSDPARVEALWQPLVWQERRFPARSYFSAEFMCPLPAALVTRDGGTVGVVADPSETPFRIPTLTNSRFGVLVRNARGEAQPQVFAPVLGGQGSWMEAGSTSEFRVRLIVREGGWYESFRHVAQELFGFHDYRENAGGSLNETIDNMLAFVMDDHYSEWLPDQRAFNYGDVNGTVKVVSSLHPLSLALLTDDQELYVRRALPMIEFLMSREKYLFSLRPDIKGQNASHFLRGPAAEVSELAALFLMSGKRTPVFLHYAEELDHQPRELNLLMKSESESWQNALALYRAQGDHRYLERAMAGADHYIAARIANAASDFTDVHVDRGGEFWTDFAPKWIDLLELYEETKESRYLEAAHRGAELYASYAWLSPPVPPGNITIHPGGMLHARRLRRAPEQTVPAWRVAHLGMISEASSTYASNYAVFLSHFAPYFLRIAYYTGDTLLHDIARSAVVGRYTNYAGYNIQPGEWTTLYDRPDFPLRTFRPFFTDDWTNAVGGLGAYYSNHIFPNIALLADFLISDAFTRSKGNIDFPSEYAQGYAYLHSKVYGDRPGAFYGSKGVNLWMPRKLLRVDNIQVNYLSGYGKGLFYLALLNQSSRAARVKVTLNPDMVPVDVGRSYRVRTWEENLRGPEIQMVGGQVEVPIAAKGITGLVVEDLPVATRFQDKVFDQSARPLSNRSYSIAETPFGGVTGMLISMGRNVDSAYIWLGASGAQVKEARLHYRDGDAWKEAVDTAYPFEFTVPVNAAQPVFEYWLEAVRNDGSTAESETLELRR